MTIYIITGSPSSGKSTYALHLSKLTSSVVIPQDSFYDIESFDLFPYDKEIAKNGNIESSNLVNWPKLLKTIMKLKNEVNIIVEGHRVAEYEPIMALADVVIYLNIKYSFAKKRFMNRYSECLTCEQMFLKGEYFDKYTWPLNEHYRINYIEPLSGVFYLDSCNPINMKKFEEMIN